MGTLSGKVAMITGSGGESGFGRAIAQRFAAEGADLVLTDVAPTGTKVVSAKPASGWGGLEAVAAEARAAGGRALTAIVDVRSAVTIEAAVKQALDTFGRLDVLVSNAAAPPGADRVPVADLTEAAWDLVQDVNLKGTFLCARAAARAMLAGHRGGRIITMSSNCGRRGYAGMAAYCASKFGVIGLTQSLALELAPAGITANAICPGPAETDRLDFLGRRADGSYDPAQRAAAIRERAATIPVGRLATTDDVAALAVFLAGNGSAHITGQAINVSGGAILH
ncbi:MAG TPA: SDR family NAD(P)-dependent oxidoreductase [Methylomirabilota bacterium]|nr:SDR family NAD(P)-dependent oxidoreductase [Methylomirabilota bacterium]